MIPTPAFTVPLVTVPLPRVPAPLSRIPSVARSLYLLAQPHGGQRSSRQNAWAGMSENAAVGRSWAEADAAMVAAQRRAVTGGSQTGAPPGRRAAGRAHDARTGQAAHERTG